MPAAQLQEIHCKTALNRVAAASSMPFRWTLNPYRGCQHACVYCFARVTHEYLGFDAGREFDTKLLAKVNMPEVLREELRKPTWKRELIALGTACDPYEPAERRYGITRRLLKVLLDFANPVSITTKSRLVRRDIDLLRDLAGLADVRVNFSIATLNTTVWRSTEPGAPHPRHRLEAMQELVESGVPAGVLMAPIIPGLSDDRDKMEELIRAARDHKAQFLHPIVLHLRPGSREWFMPFLQESYPELARRYGAVFRGSYARRDVEEEIHRVAHALRAEYGLDERGPLMDRRRGQLALAV